jgi:hypothetical protein
MNRVAEVNQALKKLGAEERLRRGNGYYYFAGGDAAAWETSSVYTNRAELTTVDGWLREYERLKGDRK